MAHPPSRPYRRAKLVLDGISVFCQAEPIRISQPTSRERAIMAQLCCERSLEAMYYEGALSLWMRVRSSYQWSCEACQNSTCTDCHLFHMLLVALHLTIKYCGPADTVYHWTSIRQAQEKWRDLTQLELIQQEVDMCRRLNWKFF